MHLAATTAVFDELVEKAPAELKDDLRTLASAWAGMGVVLKDDVVLKELDLVLKDIDLSNPSATSAETLAKLQELTAKLHAPAVQQAEQAATNLSAWSNEHCGTGTTTPP